MGHNVDQLLHSILVERKAYDTPAGFLLHLRHLAAYTFAQSACASKIVLEIGANVGYGSEILAGVAARYLGLDIALKDLIVASRLAPRGTFLHGTAVSLPLAAATVDVVVSFQVIEHVDDLSFLQEAHRVLKPGGVLYVTTPNRRLRLLPFQRPWNPEHLREYGPRAFRKTMSRVFSSVQVLGLAVPDEVYLLERRRVRQDPVRVYCAMLGIPSRPLVKLLACLGRGCDTEKEQALSYYASRYHPRDFRFAAGSSETALDLLAVCRKT